MTHHKLKNDKYVKARDGNSYFLDLYCSRCEQFLVLYQKDGQGALIRLYLDRFFAPKELAVLQYDCKEKKDMPNLKCSKCGVLIATPMMYESEQRPAFRLIRGAFVKKMTIDK
ncbi:MAG: hypothetical protein Q8P11_03755 [bacterium]|nr:hypothetical protein [bacterium]